MSFGEESHSMGPSVSERRESLLGDNRLRWQIDSSFDSRLHSSAPDAAAVKIKE